TGQTGRRIVDVAGPLTTRFVPEPAYEALRTMRPDGTWAFVNTEDMRKGTLWTTKGKYDSLGEDGSTSLGTCVQAAMPMIRYAEFSGDPELIAGVVKALDAMARFRVPRGAQVWEVHQQIPDIR